MAEKGAKMPTLDRPGKRWTEWALWGVGALVMAGIGVGSVVLTKRPESVAPMRQIILESGGLPADFFAAQERPEPEVVEVERIVYKNANTPGRQDPVRAAEVERARAVERARQVEVAKAKAAEKQRVSERNKALEALNEKRRKSASAMVRNENADQVSWVNADKRWDEPSITPSYPTPLDRVLTVDRRIPAILIEAIHSELSGKVTAQVEENVYAAHGRKILIPAGTKAIGRYNAIKKIGEERIPINWVRLITPDGINIHVGDAEMTDAMGRAGITGEVDHRYSERYGVALLFSTLNAATAYQVPVESEGQAIIVESYGREMSTLGNTILNEHINIKPVVKIPAGQRILISPSKDIWFKEPVGKEASVVAFADGGKQ